MDTVKTDILILGSGGAGLFAALHAKRAAPDLKVTVAVKGLLGKCGCTRMVQGGYNVALAPEDSIERHFMDTIEGGKWLPDQDLAWKLVTTAIERVHELENELGCFFDRNPDGSLHQKAFAGQTFDRTVHKGDLTGIEIINRLAEQVWARDVERMEEHRAVGIIPARDGSGVSGVLMIDMRTGVFRFVQARAVLLATGGGPTMYKYHTPSGDKSCDGMAMALRAGLALRDMEMVQFHPTGLLAGDHTRMTGTVLEEGLRGAGGHLLNGLGERFMTHYDERGERATRDIVSRGIYSEMRAGRTTPNGGVHIRMSHLGPDDVRVKFKGMVERCSDCGFDLAGGLVEVVPTAHYMMGGLMFNPDCSTAMAGLFAAGEDTGGVHGANRLGGNGVANSTVFGGVAGDSMAEWVAAHGRFRDADTDVIDQVVEDCMRPVGRTGSDLSPLRERLFDIMWDRVGIMRNEADLKRALGELEGLADELEGVGVGEGSLSYNVSWHDWMNLRNLIMVSRSIATAAFKRNNSRGAHYREDYTDAGDLEKSAFTRIRYLDGQFVLDTEAVRFSRVAPGQSLLDNEQSTGT